MQVNTVPQRVALYARVSSEEQREGQTIDSQIAELERFARQSAWDIVKVYKDDGWRGAILARPALDELRDDASRGYFQAVLINDVDRLARDVSHLGVIKRDLARHGVQLIFRKLPAEQSPTQNLMVNILGSFAEFERELIADRTRRGKRYKIEARKLFVGCIAPYGYRYTPRNGAAGREGILEVNTEEARVVRQMHSWVDSEGLSTRQVLHRLNREGTHPRKGSTTWARSSVLRILRSEVYVGVWYYNKLESCEPLRPVKNDKYRRSPKSGRRLRARTEWLPVELPEQLHVIKRDQWERVQHQLDKNRAFSPRNSRHMYLLSGLVRCGACGRRCVGDPSHGKFYYRCHARCKLVPTVKEDILNESVWTALESAVLRPRIIIESVVKLNRHRNGEAGSNKRELAEIEKSLQGIGVEETRLLEAYRQGVISAAQLGSELEKLGVRRSSAEARKTSLMEQAPRVSLPDVTRSVSSYCSLIAAQLEDLSAEGRRRLLRLLINEIVFDGFTAKIKGIIPSADHQDALQEAHPGGSGNESSLGRIATTQIREHGHNPARITTTQIGEHDRNPAMDFLLTVAVGRKPVAKVDFNSNVEG